MTRKDLIPINGNHDKGHKTTNGFTLLMYTLAALFMTLFIIGLTVVLQ